MLPTVRAVKNELGLIYADVSNVAFSSVMADSVLTLNWKLNSNDLFDNITFNLVDKSTLKSVSKNILSKSNTVIALTIYSNTSYVLIGELKKNNIVVGKIHKIFN